MIHSNGSSRLSAVVIWERRIRVMTTKELLQLLRDRILVGFIIYAFTVNLYLVGLAVSFQVRNAATVVSDADRSVASRALVDRFRPPVFRIDSELRRPEEGGRLLDQGRAMLMVDIPSGFERSLLRGDTARVQLQVDATNTGLAILATGDAAQVVGTYAAGGLSGSDPARASAAASGPRIVDDHRLWFNPNGTDAWATTLIQLLVMVTVLAILLPATAMVREKERGTVEQLLVSPLSTLQLMLPKIISMTLVTLACTAVSLFGLLQLVFHVPARGSLTLFFLVTALYVFTTTGLGLFLATIARTVAQVGMLVSAALPPMVFLSGAWSPPEAMPRWLQLGAVDLIPLHYYLDIGFGILLKGDGVALLWRPILAIATLGSVIFALGAWRFRRQFG